MKIHYYILRLLTCSIIALPLMGVAATFTVTNNLGDLTVGSLRWAIQQAESTPLVADIIEFDAPYVIQPGGQINITSPVTIDGTSSGGRVEIDGNGQPFFGLLFLAGSDNSVVQGLYMHGYANPALVIQDANNIQIGGSRSLGQGNVISGNTNNTGILVQGTGNGHQFIGNNIGTNTAGTLAEPNTGNGISIIGTVTNVTIGGTTADERNIISGNTVDGIFITSGSHTIRGNYIGTDVTGSIDLGNGNDGIDFTAAGNSNIVGGLTVGERNVISGNGSSGIRSNGTENLEIYGNIIGLDAGGLNDLGNDVDGIFGRDGDNSHQIGGPTIAHRNIISGNGRDGIFYDNNNTGLLIQNNYIGTNINGQAGIGDLGNSRDGVYVANNTTNNNISDNVISGNGIDFMNGQGNGSGILAVNSSDNTITNNIIGMEADGLTALGNYENGINMINSGIGTFRDNVVSSNGSWHPSTNATFPLSETPIPGELPFGHGIVVNGSSNVAINGNKIGVDINGEGDFGNSQSGIIFIFGDGFTVGTSNPADRNIIGNNTEFGIHFVQVGNNSIVQNNLIGESATGLPIGNDGGGIYLNSGITANPIHIQVGGNGVNEQNVIANTTGNNLRFASGCGVCIDGDGGNAGSKNLVSQNSISCNFGLGIDLDFNNDMYDHWSNEWWPGPSTPPTPGTGNIGKPAPTVDPYRTSSTIVTGTGLPGDRIQLFDNSCDCEGETYLSSTTVNGSGTWQATIPAVADSSYITAIAIDANNNTSEFTACCRVQADSLATNDDTLCLGEATTLTLSYHVGENFQLQSSTTTSGPWTAVGAAKTDRNDSIWTVTPTTTGSTFYRIYATATSWGAPVAGAICADSSEAVEIVVNPAAEAGTAAITSPICAGADAILSLTGYTGTIAWQDSSAANDWTNLGLTTDNETIAGKTTADSPIHYRAILTNNPGGCTDTSNVVVLTITDQADAGTIDPLTPICEGEDITISTVGSSGTLVWQDSLAASGSWNNLTGTSSSETYSSTGTTNRFFRVIAGTGQCADTSNIVEQVINPAAEAGTAAITSPICAGADATLSLASYTGTIAWQDSSAANNWTDIGATTDNETISGKTTTDSPIYYRAILTNNPGGCTDTSNVVVLTITDQADAGTIDPLTPICEGQDITISTVGSSGTLVWQDSLAASGSWNNLTGTSSSETYSSTGTTNRFFRVIAGTGQCADTSNIVEQVINPAAEAGTAAITSPICAGADAILSLTGYTGTIAWQDSSAANDWTNLGLTTDNETIAGKTTADSPIHYRAILTNNPGGCTDTSNVVVLTITDQADAGTIDPLTPICEGEDITISTVGSSGTLVWQDSLAASGSWNNLTGTSSSETYSSTGTTNRFFRVIAGTGQCADTSNIVEQVINPAAEAGTAAITSPICAGADATLSLASYTGTIAWQDSSAANNWTDIGATTDNETISGKTTTDSPIYYRAILTNNPGGCTDTSNVVVLTITDQADAGTIDPLTPICEGEDITISTVGSSGTLVWQDSLAASGSWNNLTGTSSSETYSSTGTTNRFFRVIAGTGQCADTSNIVEQVINPAAEAGTAAITSPICAGADATLSSC